MCLSVVTYLYLCCECSEQRFDIVWYCEFTSLNSVPQFYEEGMSKEEGKEGGREGGRRGVCTCIYMYVNILVHVLTCVVNH